MQGNRNVSAQAMCQPAGHSAPWHPPPRARTGSAPASSSMHTMSTAPARAANCSGVIPANANERCLSLSLFEFSHDAIEANQHLPRQARDKQKGKIQEQKEDSAPPRPSASCRPPCRSSIATCAALRCRAAQQSDVSTTAPSTVSSKSVAAPAEAPSFNSWNFSFCLPRACLGK